MMRAKATLAALGESREKPSQTSGKMTHTYIMATSPMKKSFTSHAWPNTLPGSWELSQKGYSPVVGSGWLMSQPMTSSSTMAARIAMTSDSRNAPHSVLRCRISRSFKGSMSSVMNTAPKP